MSAGTERRANIDRALEHRGIDVDADLSMYQLKELMRVVQMMGGRIRYDGNTLTAASLDTDADQGANAAMIFTAGAAAPGAAGNRIEVEIADTATAASETVDYAVDNDGVITVTLGVEAGVSTATQTLAALAADAGTLLSGALKTGNDGSGVVSAMAATALTDGADADGFVITPAA